MGLTLLRTRCVTRQRPGARGSTPHSPWSHPCPSTWTSRRASLFATAGLAFTFAFFQAITVLGAYAPVAFGE